MKRFLVVFFAGVGLILGVVLVWQPEALQRQVVAVISDRIARTTPYRLQVHAVSGNFFTQFSFHDVHVRAAEDPQDLIHIQVLKIGVSWIALLHKKIQLSHVILEAPEARLVLDDNKHGTAIFPAFIDRIEIHQGALILINPSMSPAAELRVAPVDLQARLTPSGLSIVQLKAGVERGNVLLRGHVGLTQPVSADLDLITKDFPLHLLARMMSPVPPSLILTHSGTWNIRSSQEGGWNLREGGTLNGTLSTRMTLSVDHLSSKKINAEGMVALSRLSEARRSSAAVVVRSRIRQGAGFLTCDVALDGLTASATAQVNLPVGRVQSQFQAALSSFTGLSEFVPALKTAQGRITASGRAQGTFAALHVDAAIHGQQLSLKTRKIEDLELQMTGQTGRSQNMKVQGAVKNAGFEGDGSMPWDIEGGHFTAQGIPLRWNSSVHLEFRNKSRLDYAGLMNKTGQIWKIDWDLLALALPTGPELRNSRPGELEIEPNGSLRIQHLAMTCGTGTLVMNQGFISKKTVDFDLLAAHIDPSMLTASIAGLTIDKDSAANLNVKVTGIYPDLSMNGNLTATIPHILIQSAGLDLRDMNVDIQSTGKTIQIKQFAAKTKKGELHISGQSTIPHLNFAVEGQKIALNIPQKLAAMADVHLLIGGELMKPDLSGDIKINEATYKTPKQTKKERELEQKQKEAFELEQEQVIAAPTPARQSQWEEATVNVHAQWPGRVYYRDGLTNVETSGDLRVRKDAGTDLYMTGRIDIVRGIYDAYGRDFILNQGNIIFTGPPDINPQLNLQALYSSGGTVVTLAVKGTAKAPTLSLSSNPPLDEQDIVSVLVLGQPLNKVGADQGPSTNKSAQAQALAGSVIGGYVSQHLRENGMDVLGLDVVQVQSSTSGGNLLTVGRYIGQKLFVSYGQPLQSSAQRLFDANYYLSPRWTVVGETGEASDTHMDFQFRYPLNTPHYPKEPAPFLVREPEPEATKVQHD